MRGEPTQIIFHLLIPALGIIGYRIWLASTLAYNAQREPQHEQVEYNLRFKYIRQEARNPSLPFLSSYYLTLAHLIYTSLYSKLNVL